MPVHSLHIFDRKGKTLFTKRFIMDTNSNNDNNADAEQLAEQRKLVFGMLFSLREVAASLSPPPPENSRDNHNNGLHSVRTGATTLYNYETSSGLRFALYVANYQLSQTTTSMSGGAAGTTGGGSGGGSSGGGGDDDLKSTGTSGSAIMSTVTTTTSTNTPVVAAPDTSVRAALEYIYNDLWIQCVTRSPLYRPTEPNVDETNFEAKLTSFLRAQPWFR